MKTNFSNLVSAHYDSDSFYFLDIVACATDLLCVSVILFCCSQFVLLWMWVFAKCHVSVLESFVVLCSGKPSLQSPSKQIHCWPQVCSSSIAVFTVMRVNQLNFYISIVLPTPCSYSVFVGGQVSISAKPNIHGSYPDSEWHESVWACMFMHESVWFVCVLSVLAVIADLWWRMCIFSSFLSPRSLNTLSCGVQFWHELD